MLQLNLPSFDIKIKKTKHGIFLFDRLRSKYVAFTPEEWVRQHFVEFLISYRAYPSGLIVNEMQIKHHKCTRRCDTIIYNRLLQPLAIIEYKAPHIPISQEVFEQIARYNHVLNVPCLMLSNGLNHHACLINASTGKVAFLKDIPHYSELLSLVPSKA